MDKKGAGGEDGSKRPSTTPMVQAHPIVGWKGFEDVVASIPGETVDIVQKLPIGQDGSPMPPVSSLSEWLVCSVDVSLSDAVCQCFRESVPRPRWSFSWVG